MNFEIKIFKNQKINHFNNNKNLSQKIELGLQKKTCVKKVFFGAQI